MNADEKFKFIEYLLSEIGKAKFFRFYSITVKKENVRIKTFKEDSNTLYNYMTKLGILSQLVEMENIWISADQRVTSTDAKYASDTYLKTELAGTYNSAALIDIKHISSHTSRHLQCADIVTNLIWRGYFLAPQ